MLTVFFRVLEAEQKAEALLEVIRGSRRSSGCRRFDAEATRFSAVPRSPFAYWVSPRLLALFSDAPLQNTFSTRTGMQTCDDFRFARLHFEVASSSILSGRWRAFAKGGAYSPYYSDLHLVVTWGAGQTELEAFGEIKGNSARSRQSSECYFRPGLSWPARTNGLSLRAMPRDCIFGHKGPAAFLASDDPKALLALLAVTNSRTFGALVSLQLARTELAQSFEVGLIERTPVPSLGEAESTALASVARRSWSLKRSLDAHVETSHAFTLPILLQLSGAALATCVSAWAERIGAMAAELGACQAEVDARCLRLYGIDETDQDAFAESFERGPSEDDAGSEKSAGLDGEAEGADDETALADGVSLVGELVSWSIGVAFGRFDLRLATGERALPPEPDPFDPLPVCSPVSIPGADGLPCATPPFGYPIDFPQDGVLLDDPGHPRDLTAFARAVFDVVFGADADARWQEAAGILDPKNHDLRAFVAGTFFEQHLKRYSKSRRKAPIYWQLGTPSANYSVWLYAHRLTPDTFFHVLHDFVAPKLALEERKLLSLTQESGPNPTASQRKGIAGQETFVDELRAFRDEVTRVAPLWKPDLDDGVVLTMAPLWRLVPQHRAWQKELKAAWDSLCAGEYDWAHVAMHLWPERVVPKCATDRSLAIAHGLEEVFWEEDAKGKWVARSKPLRSIEALVRERASPAVRAAVSGIIDTGVPLSVPGGGRKRRAR